MRKPKSAFSCILSHLNKHYRRESSPSMALLSLTFGLKRAAIAIFPVVGLHQYPHGLDWYSPRRVLSTDSAIKTSPSSAETILACNAARRASR
jgi:hypothetical protein